MMIHSEDSNSRPAPRPRHAGAVATLALLALTALGGCSNLSGLGGSTEFGCKAPVGTPCMSVSGVNANERAGNLPFQRTASNTAGSPDASGPSPAAQPASSRAGLLPVSDAAPAGFIPALGALRSDPTVIRIWIPPWEDADGDLVDQSFVYLQIDSGRWLIEHNREAIRKTFAPRAATTAVAPAVEVRPSAAAAQNKTSSPSAPAMAAAAAAGSSK